MPDFNFVTSRIATGAGINSLDDALALVQGAGLDCVVDCRSELDDAQFFTAFPQVKYLYNGTDDDGQPKVPSWYEKGIQFGLSCLAQPNARLYFHCAAGINRGPSLCFALLLALGIAPDRSEAMIRAVRPQVGLAYRDDAIIKVKALGYC